ncbi:helix-turn-helix transcriptional regulator [Candidatus Methanoperedens nitratireducens]|uniref:Putative transcriptional regulator n=1 Tax=Candidatus Methanoperedens nitratireducens TaxID=1392998 RepID=A0A284VI16_9EURY|nr:winged helix-turn-helix domain-containing protein [Candidatus Methanoperedens nitroreducens]SNQ58901.1 putative transcriptional regulator [Candidatus Methanoperedens nitroreducens]
MNKLVSTITFSKKRENLLLFLIDGPKTLEDIRISLNVTSSGMIPQIRKLEEQNLVWREGKMYSLTDTGTVIAEMFNSFVKTIDIIEKYTDFWESHDINAIPHHLLKRLYELGNCNLVESRPENIYEPHREFLENILSSNKLRGVSPIFHPIYPSFFTQLSEKGKDVSLVLTRDVFRKVEKEYGPELARILNLKNGRLYVCDEDIKLAFVTTDVFFSMSLFFKDGAFDTKKDMVSFDISAISWGEELFNYYKERSEEITSL